MSFVQTSDALSRRELLGLGVAGLLAGVGPKSARAMEDDEKASSKIYFNAGKGRFRLGRQLIEPGAQGTFSVDPARPKSLRFLIEGYGLRVSPDRRSLAYLETPSRKNDRVGVWVIDLETEEKKRVGEMNGLFGCWSPDGKELIVSNRTPDAAEGSYESWRIVVADPSQKTRVSIPRNDFVADWSPDGKTILVLKSKDENGKPFATFYERSAHLHDLEGKDLGRAVASAHERVRHRFTRDGKRITYVQTNVKGKPYALRIVDIDGKNDRLLFNERDDDAPWGPAVWSPDGKSVAVNLWDRSPLGHGRISCYKLVIVDSRGENPRPLALPNDIEHINLLDWQ